MEYTWNEKDWRSITTTYFDDNGEVHAEIGFLGFTQYGPAWGSLSDDNKYATGWGGLFAKGDLHDTQLLHAIFGGTIFTEEVYRKGHAELTALDESPQDVADRDGLQRKLTSEAKAKAKREAKEREERQNKNTAVLEPYLQAHGMTYTAATAARKYGRIGMLTPLTAPLCPLPTRCMNSMAIPQQVARTRLRLYRLKGALELHAKPGSFYLGQSGPGVRWSHAATLKPG